MAGHCWHSFIIASRTVCAPQRASSSPSHSAACRNVLADPLQRQCGSATSHSSHNHKALLFLIGFALALSKRGSHRNPGIDLPIEHVPGCEQSLCHPWATCAVCSRSISCNLSLQTPRYIISIVNFAPRNCKSAKIICKERKQLGQYGAIGKTNKGGGTRT